MGGQFAQGDLVADSSGDKDDMASLQIKGAFMMVGAVHWMISKILRI